MFTSCFVGFVLSKNNCCHSRRGTCKKISVGLPCEVGLRTRTYYVLSGSVLSVWNKVESVLSSMPSTMQTKMQIIRLRTDDNQRIVGTSRATGLLCFISATEAKK